MSNRIRSTSIPDKIKQILKTKPTYDSLLQGDEDEANHKPSNSKSTSPQPSRKGSGFKRGSKKQEPWDLGFPMQFKVMEIAFDGTFPRIVEFSMDGVKVSEDNLQLTQISFQPFRAIKGVIASNDSLTFSWRHNDTEGMEKTVQFRYSHPQEMKKTFFKYVDVALAKKKEEEAMGLGSSHSASSFPVDSNPYHSGDNDERQIPTNQPESPIFGTFAGPRNQPALSAPPRPQNQIVSTPNLIDF